MIFLQQHNAANAALRNLVKWKDNRLPKTAVKIAMSLALSFCRSYYFMN